MTSKHKPKRWLHPADVLIRSAVTYNCKFLGSVAVDQPKGLDVVREAIRKMKFNKQIKKAEGVKSPKVDLSISVDGVQVRNPKLRILQEVIALHRISFCADDKQDKRIFSFIAKNADSTDHMCFVFDSNKRAEDITLTIGQAFHLAYRRFLAKTCGDSEQDMSQRVILLQRRNHTLEEENVALHNRVLELETQMRLRTTSDAAANRAAEELEAAAMQPDSPMPLVSPPIPPRAGEMRPSAPPATSALQTPPRAEVGRRLENLSFDDSFVDANGTLQFPQAEATNGKDSNEADPLYAEVADTPRTMMDMQAGFSRGLSMDQGHISFALDDFDPLSPTRSSTS